MSNNFKHLNRRRWQAPLAAALLGTFAQSFTFAESVEEISPISPNLADRELVEFSKAEPRFAASAFPLVQSRICTYAEAAATSFGQANISDLRVPRTTVPPRSDSLTNAILTVRLYVGFTPPSEASQGETAATWNELGFLALERANAVLHHHYLAVEYRDGLEDSLAFLRQATRELVVYLDARANAAMRERLSVAKAQYAALWFEKCEEVVPTYRKLLGTGAIGAVRDALVIRPELPLVTGWSWDQRKKADAVHKSFIHELMNSTNVAVRIEGLLLHAARTRTERAFVATFTKLVDAIDSEAQNEGTRTAYSNLLRGLLDDRHSRSILDKTRNELRGLYEARFVALEVPTTNTPPALAPEPVDLDQASKKIETRNAPPTETVVVIPKFPVRPKPPLSWQVLLSPSEVRYWEEMPLVELRTMARDNNVIANYYLFLKLASSESSELVAEAEAALTHAFKAEFPQAQLVHANRQLDAEERFYWTKKAAGTGFPVAQLALGVLHIRGHGTAPDLDRGLGLVRAAYDLNVPEAEMILAECYASGLGAPRNSRETAAALFLNAARRNESKAMLELHHRYLSGYLVSQDQLEACRWLVNAGLNNKELPGAGR